MSRDRLPPAQAEACLTSPRSSRYKGGTVVDERVWTLEQHLKLICSPDGYRPEECRNCGGSKLHMHDRVLREPRGITLCVAVTVMRYICVRCRATWRVLPAFLARHLWWAWRAVEGAIGASDAGGRDTPAVAAEQPSDTSDEERPPVVPARTLRRWRSRLASSARQVVVLIAGRGVEAVKAVSAQVGLDASRWQLVHAHTTALAVMPGRRLASVGSLADRLERGIRLM